MQTLCEILIGCALFALLLFGVAQLTELGKARACDNYATATGEVVKYVKWDRCYVQTPSGKWRTLNQLRIVED